MTWEIPKSATPKTHKVVKLINEFLAETERVFLKRKKKVKKKKIRIRKVPEVPPHNKPCPKMITKIDRKTVTK